MEQYLDAKIKRFTQKQLFKKITKVNGKLARKRFNELKRKP